VKGDDVSRATKGITNVTAIKGNNAVQGHRGEEEVTGAQ
jgi:hypothetical protein